MVLVKIPSVDQIDLFGLLILDGNTSGCRIHQLHLQRGASPHHHHHRNKCPVYDMVRLQLCWSLGMWSTSSLLSFPGLFCSVLVAPDRVLSMGQIKLFNHFIIIIISCRQHGYLWPSLATPPYCSLLLAGPQGYIPYRHRPAVCRFELVVLLLLGHMLRSIGVHHLWARSCFSNSVLYVWFV